MDEAVLVEQVVSMPIVNPETGGQSQTFEFVGKTDLVEGTKVIDWKGTGDPARFIQQRKIGFQAELYALALRKQGRYVQQIEYRLITRPTLKYSEPKHSWAVVKPTAKRALKVFDTAEEAADCASAKGANVEHRVSGDADRDTYETRCLEWLQEEPRRLVTHRHFITDSRLKQAKQWLWDCTKRILDCRKNDRWMPNEGACWAYGRECPYAPLCEGIVDGIYPSQILEQDYERTEPHPELDGYKPTTKRAIATHSSLTTLALCEVRYYWRYEGCWRRGRDYSEPLWTGSAMHAGMEGVANKGLEAGLAAVDAWAAKNMVLGPDAAWLQEQQIARARAMCRVADMKWGSDV